MAARRTTRASAIVTDENSVTARGSLIPGKASTLIGFAGKHTNSVAAPILGRRRTALADQSNKVNNVVPAGGKQGSIKSTSTAREENVRSVAAVKATIAASRPRTRSSISKNDVDSTDSVMEAIDDDTHEIKVGRPIKSLRASTVAANAAASSSSVAVGRAAVQRARPSNIPRTSHTSTSNTGSIKNAGLIPAIRNAAAAAVLASTSAAAVTTEKGITRKRSTKNVGLVRAAKREIQELTHDQSEWVDDDDQDVQPGHRVERRRSKRLRASDPEDPLVDTSSGLHGSIAGKLLDDTDNPVDEDVDVESEIAKDDGWVDLDIGDEEDPLMCSEYVKEIHEYMQQIELNTKPDPQYMARQSELTWKMRSILVDWLIEVHSKFRLLPETIFLACNILDRLLSLRTVSLVKFQLVGVVSLFIAAKYEEVVCPSVSSFLYMTDGGYADADMLTAERYILKQLDFNLSYPNPINFVRRISKADGYDIQTRTVAKYFVEMCCVDRRLIGTVPSMIAAAGMWLARKVLNRGDWHCNLVHYSTYSQSEILPTAQIMLDYVLRRSQQPGEPLEHPHFYKKYSSKKFYRAAEVVRDWAELNYLSSKKPPPGASGKTKLFPALEGHGRLEEWEEEGHETPSIDFE